MAENSASMNIHNAKPLIMTFLVTSALYWTPASAEEIKDLSVTDALRMCAAFEKKDERLACFEALASTVAPTQQNAEADVPDASENTESLTDTPTRSASDTSAPTEENATRPLAEDESFTFVRTTKTERERDRAKKERKQRKKHTLTVYRAWRNGAGDLRIAFTNGEIWRQSGRGTSYDPKPGEQVVMKPGLVGGWTVSMRNGSRGVRMRKMN